MVTILMPAGSSRLTTLETACQRLGITPGSVDPSVVTMIDAASGMVSRFCGRTFGRETVRQSEVIERVSCGILLDRSPVISITSVTESGTALAPGHYHVDPETNMLLRLANGGRSLWGGVIEVTYTAGWLLPDQNGADLPSEVEEAVLRIIAALHGGRERDPLVKSEQVEGIGRTDFWVPGSADHLPDPIAERILQPYRRYS